MSRISWARNNLGVAIIAQIMALLILVPSHVALNMQARSLKSELVEVSYVNGVIDSVQNNLIAARVAEHQYALTTNHQFLKDFQRNVSAYEKHSSDLKKAVSGVPMLASAILEPILLGQKWIDLYGTPHVGTKASMTNSVALHELTLLDVFDEKISAANSVCDTGIIAITKKLNCVDRLSLVINVSVLSLTTLIVTMLILRHIKYRARLVEYEKTQLVEHLAASMAHEIRNPLQVTRGFMQLIRERVSDAQIAQYWTYAINELDAAHHILSEYLGLSKPQAAGPRLESLHTIVGDVLQLLTAYGNEWGCQITQTASDLPDAQFDALKLKQVLLNIGKNAIEAMGHGGELTLRVKSSPSRVAIHIQDSGPGMSKDQLSRLGQPFYTTKTSGTGIGLLIAYRLVEELHGRISVRSELGKGTCFQVLLPRQASITTKAASRGDVIAAP